MDSTQPRPQNAKRQPRKTCKHSGCATASAARGLCGKHYSAWRKATPLEERRLTPAIRFWQKVDQCGPVPVRAPELGPCWLWTGAMNGPGYGKLRANKKWFTAHRWSYEARYGPIPEGLFVCHRCDTPACVRPTHLFAGTSAQNTRDMFEKGRAACRGPLGEQNSHHKLMDEQVVAIRDRFQRGELIRCLASEHEVTVGTISDIVNGRTWKHLGGPVRLPGQIGRRARKAA